MANGKRRFAFLLLFAGLAILATLALFLGRYPKPGFMTPFILRDDPIARSIVFSVRLPRVIGALLVGAALGGAGAAFQLIFANPLVEPGFLGVSQGAAFGAALAIVAGFRGWPITLSAFGFALTALALSAALGRRFRYGGSVLRLVLAGIAVSAVFSGALAIVKYAADPLRDLPDITYWTLGGLSGMTAAAVASLAPAIIASSALLLIGAHRLDLLSLDDEVARSLGARPELERSLMAAAAALGTAAAVANSGVIAWAGLVVPHAARLLVGARASASLPASMIIGAAFVLAADTAARSLFAGELPLGAVVAIVGAAAFASLLVSGKARISR